jgi:hypothetical protein
MTDGGVGAEGTPPAVARLLAGVRAQMDLDGETETEVLDELRDHLEEALARARAEGLDEVAAEARVAADFGLEEAGRQLQAAHAGWGTADAVVAAGLPVFCALVLRWLAFAPDGTALGWPQLLDRPSFWIVAMAALVIPVLRFDRWRYALAAWAFFWMLTIISVTFPSLRW